MIITPLKLLLFGLLVFGAHTVAIAQQYESENLVIQKVSDHVYQHTSFLDAGSFGMVPCNGMIVINEKEAVIFDTPTDDATSSELIDWVENELGSQIKAIIPTHFHQDCLAGLEAFHQREIPSYASNLTIDLAKANDKTIPENGFDSLLILEVGNKEVHAEFLGEGHTRDNVISYFPEDQVIFGGCLIKEMDAGKGNLEDANINAWPQTVAKVKEKYANVRTVIPGHGKPGGIGLLDYTIQLFE